MLANMPQEVSCIKYRMESIVDSLCEYKITRSSKKLSITELELCGLAIDIANFSHILKRVDFDAMVGHLKLTHIIKSNAEPDQKR